MKYGLSLVSRRPYEPEKYWEKTDRGLAVSAYIPNLRQKYTTDDINQACRQSEYLTYKLQDHAKDFPPSDYYWAVDEIQETVLSGDLTGSSAGPQMINEIWGSHGSTIPGTHKIPGIF